MADINVSRSFFMVSYKVIQLFYFVFYIIGIVGLSISWTFPFFVKLIPFAILLSSAGLILFHSDKMEIKTVLFFSGIYLTSFIIEAIGVNTGFIFGNYYYGNALGLKILGTPLIIGLNWLLLVYITSNIVRKLKIGSFLQILLASLFMIVYDLILEHVAPALDMWYWKSSVPLQNYIAWFVIAIIFHSFIEVFKINTANKLAPLILFCQLLFFITLFVYFNFIH